MCDSEIKVNEGEKRLTKTTHVVLRHVPADLQGPVPGGLLREMQRQSRVWKNVHKQLSLAV